MGQRALEVVAGLDALRLGAGRRAATRLLDVTSFVEGPFAQAASLAARASLEGDGEAQAAASLAFEEIGAQLLAADAAAAASTMHRDAGHRARAIRAAERDAALAGSCEGALTPALGGMERPAGLTDRDQEVAHLVGEGLSNREVAARLVMSLRTVENHLHHVYTKLGVGGRAELVAALRGAE